MPPALHREIAMLCLDTVEGVAAQLAAIGHDVRLRLLYRLTTGPEYVTRLAKVVGAPATNVCQHLRVMRNAGLLDCRRKGQKMLYRLRPEILTPGSGDTLATLAIGPYKMQILADNGD